MIGFDEEDTYSSASDASRDEEGLMSMSGSGASGGVPKETVAMVDVFVVFRELAVGERVERVPWGKHNNLL